MKSITEYIIESTAQDKYGTLISKIDINMNNSINKIKSVILNGVKEAITKYKVVRIEAVDKSNAYKSDQAKLEKDAVFNKVQKEVIAELQTKPGILKRSQEKQQEWINNKLKKWNDEYDKWHGHWQLDTVDFDENEMRFAWHYDIHAEHSYSNSPRGLLYLEDFIDEIVRFIEYGKNGDKDWSHLEALMTSTTSFVESSPEIHIIPIFDEETEKTLAKDVQKFQNFMCREYDRGKYMGD